MAAVHVEGAVDLFQAAGQDHVGGQAAHFPEVCTHGGEAAQNELVHVGLIVGDDEYVPAYLQVCLLDYVRQGYQTGIQLGVEQ